MCERRLDAFRLWLPWERTISRRSLRERWLGSRDYSIQRRLHHTITWFRLGVFEWWMAAANESRRKQQRVRRKPAGRRMGLCEWWVAPTRQSSRCQLHVGGMYDG